jgi:hypothetical protein
MNIFIILLISYFTIIPPGEERILADKTARKKIDKTVTAVIQSESYTLQPLKLPLDSIFANENPAKTGSFFHIASEGSMKGILYVGSAKGRYDWFDFIVVFSLELLIEKVEIIVYREDHGVEIMNKSWLAQFNGTTGCGLEYGKDIDAVSGATLSAGSLTKAVQEVCWELVDNGYLGGK